jgi:hypothetical protein
VLGDDDPGAAIADSHDFAPRCPDFMYVSARSVTDDEFKSRFLDPLIEDLHATLVARNRYRGTRG